MSLVSRFMPSDETEDFQRSDVSLGKLGRFFGQEIFSLCSDFSVLNLRDQNSAQSLLIRAVYPKFNFASAFLPLQDLHLFFVRIDKFALLLIPGCQLDSKGCSVSKTSSFHLFNQLFMPQV